MKKRSRIVALIPARGGSKSIPRKNIKTFVSKPLIAWTIEVSLQLAEIERIYVSTEDEEIAQVSRRYGADIIPRPMVWAQDTSLPIDVIRHALQFLKSRGERYDVLLYLEPTCPFRTAEDIRNTLTMIHKEDVQSVATFAEASLHPHRAWSLQGIKPNHFIEGANPWLPRQQLPPAYQLNGAVYALKIAAIDEEVNAVLIPPIGAVLMPKERSLDIDDVLDWEFAEWMKMNQKN